MPDDIRPDDPEVEAHNRALIEGLAALIPPERREKVLREMAELERMEQDALDRAVRVHGLGAKPYRARGRG